MSADAATCPSAHSSTESQERFQALVETARDVIFAAAPDGTLTFLNQACETLIGWRPEEWVGRPFLPLFHPADRPKAIEIFDRLRSGQRPPLHELRVLSKSGETVVGEFLAAPIIRNGHTIAVLGVVRDVTDRRRADQAANENALRLALALDASRMGVWEWNFVTRAVIWSRHCYAILGVEDTAPLSLDTFTSRVHPEDLPGVLAAGDEAVRNRADLAAQFRIVRPDGEVRWVASLGRIFADPDGSSRLVGTIVDTTDRVLSDAALRASEQRLQLALAAAHMGVWEWDVRTAGEFWSPRCHEILGLDPDIPLTLQTFKDRVHPDDLAGAMPAGYRALAEGADFTAEFRIIRPDGAIRWVSVSGRGRNGPDGAPRRLIGTVTDVTDQKHTEQTLRQHAREVDQFNRLAVGRELTMVALKREINALCEQLGQPPRYSVDPFEDEPAASSAQNQDKNRQ